MRRRRSDGEAASAHTRLRQLATGGVLFCVVLSGTVLAGCSSNTRSAQAVCHVWDTQAVPLGEQYQADAKSGKFDLQELADLLQAPSTLEHLMASLAAVAPEPIENDFSQLQQAFQREESSMGQAVSDPIAALVSGLANGIEVTASYNRVNTYLAQNCGPAAEGK